MLCIRSSSDNSIAGANSDQKDAATITPALNPNIVFNTFRLTSLKKHTVSDPSAVIPHVNSVANNAWMAGFKFSNQFTLFSPHIT